MCFDSLRVLLARLLVVCFVFFLSLVFDCKTLVFDPGVRGTVVGFPVLPWSCVLLVLRLACLSFWFRGVAACCVFLLSSLLALLG